MKTIVRRSMLYKTGVEYGDYTMNHVLGCAHGCKYPCYAYMMAKRFGKVSSYEDWLEPRLVSNTLAILDQEIPRLKDRIQSVQLCFTTDPFMYGYNEIREVSLAAIQKLNAAGVKCNVLTKGLLPIELAQYSHENEYGITLISLDEDYRHRIEPGAASYQDRLASLRALHDRGFRTWVSVEPYPTPNLVKQDINGILEAIGFSDRIIFGRTNYSREITAYAHHKAFYNEHAATVAAYCRAHDIDYHIKEGTVTKE